jgi:hypothetical protein
MSVRPVLMKYLTDHPGEVLHLATMMEDLRLTKQQVQQCMGWMIDKGQAEAIVRGSSWIYRPPRIEDPAPLSAYHFEGDPRPGDVVEPVETNGVEGDLMEIVRCLNDGRVLLQNSDGVLFVATRMDV